MYNRTVTIIINCYNGALFLREAIDSIYAQTYSDWDIVFWDNASTDKSAEIARSYGHRIKYFCSEETTCLGEARAQALKKATGKYIVFLDVDDLLLPAMIEEQISIFDRADNELGFVYGRVEFIFEKSLSKVPGYIYNEGEVLKGGMIFCDLCKENFVPWPSALIDRDKLIKCGGFPEKFHNSTDYWVFLNLSYSYEVGVNQRVVCKARGHGMNLAHSQYVKGAEENINAVAGFLPKPEAIIGLKYHYVQLYIAYFKEGKYLKSLGLVISKGSWKLIVHRIARRLLKRFIRIPLNLNIYN